MWCQCGVNVVSGTARGQIAVLSTWGGHSSLFRGGTSTSAAASFGY